jgi:outer membrane protein OmpA-like peptidoglycan-associated protein
MPVRDDTFSIGFLASSRGATIAAFPFGIKPAHRAGYAKLAAMALALVALSGCASQPGWLKPWTWLDDKPAPKVDSTLAYPNLAEVPPKPADTTSEDRRRELTAGLASDRANARHSDEILRNAAMADGAPPPVAAPKPAVPAAPAPVAVEPPAAAPAAAPAPVLTAPNAKPTKAGKKVGAGASSAPASSLLSAGQAGIVDFTAGSAKVEASQRAKLSNLAALQKETKGRIRIIGRAANDELAKIADPTTRIIRLFDLSLRRAQAIAAELAKMGVPTDALLVEGKGADDKAARAATITLE